MVQGKGNDHRESKLGRNGLLTASELLAAQSRNLYAAAGSHSYFDGDKGDPNTRRRLVLLWCDACDMQVLVKWSIGA